MRISGLRGRFSRRCGISKWWLRRRVLVVQKTGWGKSAVYFLAAHLLRRRGRGVSLIVSPLIALMRDQISAAERAGVRAQAVNSAMLRTGAGTHRQVRWRCTPRPPSRPRR